MVVEILKGQKRCVFRSDCGLDVIKGDECYNSHEMSREENVVKVLYKGFDGASEMF